MLKLIQPGILLIALLPLAACKTWYKPGADEEVLAADQRRCEGETLASTGKMFLECMQRAGWHHSNRSVAATRSEAWRDKVLPDEAEVSLSVTAHMAEPRHIGGWVQFGAGAEQLEDARVQCDKADTSGKTFNACMQSEGWRPITLRISVVEESDELD